MSTITARMGTLAPYVLSILRTVTALLFLQHGLSKVFSFPVPGPPLHGLLLLAAFLETVGSLLLLGGAYTRIVAFILSGETAFAYFMGHAPRSFYPIANQGEAAVLFCFIFLYISVAGAGVVSLDGEEIPVGVGSAVFIPGMAEHGIRQTGDEVLRLFYAFPVDSFDGVEYLFSAAPGA